MNESAQTEQRRLTGAATTELDSRLRPSVCGIVRELRICVVRIVEVERFGRAVPRVEKVAYAQLLHQRDKTVTKYYSRPTASQVISAAEMIFVDR
jgi:hypothetical protein